MPTAAERKKNQQNRTLSGLTSRKRAAYQDRKLRQCLSVPAKHHKKRWPTPSHTSKGRVGGLTASRPGSDKGSALLFLLGGIQSTAFHKCQGEVFTRCSDKVLFLTPLLTKEVSLMASGESELPPPQTHKEPPHLSVNRDQVGSLQL